MTTATPTTTTATPTFFVIAKQRTSDLVTSTVNLGGETGTDAAAQAALIFTEKAKAQVYLQTAEWLQTETVAELQPAPFVRWLLDCREHGVDVVAVDPDRIHQQDGIRQNVIRIESLFRSLGPAILEVMQATDFEQS